MQIQPKHPAERTAANRSREAQLEHEREVVADHYEHHPEIFMKVLDKRMAYATAAFESPDEDLDTAQERKFAQLTNKLDLKAGETLMDIGCGWGSNLLHIAQHTEAICKGITLSTEQAKIARRHAQDLGVADRVHVDVAHVEELDLEPESLDAILFSGSIVHMHNREAIHEMVARLLKPGGRLLISDCYFPAVQRGNRDSAATHYIFVTALGYCKLTTLAEELALIEAAGLDISHVADFTDSYVLTLGHWIDNIRRRRAEIDSMSPGFAKLLQTYMTVAKLSFAKRSALEYMILATKGRPRANFAAWPVPTTSEVPGGSMAPTPKPGGDE